MKLFAHKHRIVSPIISLFCIVLLNTSLPVYSAAELPELQLFGSHKATKKALSSLLSNGVTVRAEMSCLSDPETIQKLSKLAKGKENRVELHLDHKNHQNKNSQEKIGKLQKSGVHVALSPHLHAKIWHIESTKTGQQAVCIKSSNDSKNAENNHEIGCITRDEDVCAAAKLFFNNPPKCPHKTKPALSPSPIKQQLVHSFKTGINASRAERIQTAINEKKANPDRPIAITMSSMNINDKRLLSLLGDAAKSGINTILYLNGEGITDKKINILQKCRDAGVHIFVTNAAKKAIMHSKLFLRSIGLSNLLEISTANATREGDDEQNYSLYVPNAPAATVESAVSVFKDIQRVSTPLERLLVKKRKKHVENNDNSPNYNNLLAFLSRKNGEAAENIEEDQKKPATKKLKFNN